jgi:hypothetical protein
MDLHLNGGRRGSVWLAFAILTPSCGTLVVVVIITRCVIRLLLVGAISARALADTRVVTLRISRTTVRSTVHII